MWSKFVRTTAFKLSAIYIAVFSIFSIFFVVYISYTTDVLLNQQLRETIATELLGLSDQFRVGGLPAVVEVIEQRSHQPGASLYLVTDPSGRYVAGNVAEVSSELLHSAGVEPIIVSYERYADDFGERTAMVQVVRLQTGFMLLVGRDIGEREQFRQIIGSADAVTELPVPVVPIGSGATGPEARIERLCLRIDRKAQRSFGAYGADLCVGNRLGKREAGHVQLGLCVPRGGLQIAPPQCMETHRLGLDAPRCPRLGLPHWQTSNGVALSGYLEPIFRSSSETSRILWRTHFSSI